MNKSRFTVLAGMILAGALSRLVPHPPNFTPVAAVALFGGATFADKRSAFVVPLAALLLSDLLLGFSALTPLVYGSFALIVCLGFWVRRRRSVGRIASAAIMGAALFFFVTNLGVWAITSLYPKTLTGLVECYVAAIPFFWNTLAGDLVYCGLLFGALALAETRWPALAESHAAFT